MHILLGNSFVGQTINNICKWKLSSEHYGRAIAILELLLIKAQIPLASSRLDTTLLTCRARRDERVELCSSTSSTQPKCMIKICNDKNWNRPWSSQKANLRSINGLSWILRYGTNRSNFFWHQLFGIPFLLTVLCRKWRNRLRGPQIWPTRKFWRGAPYEKYGFREKVRWPQFCRCGS